MPPARISAVAGPHDPSYFFKPSSSVAASGGTIARPAGTELLAFEGEIALVIGTAARRVSLADAWQHVGWVTAANDFGLYDLRANDKGSNVRSKGGDGFTPIGPVAHRCALRRPVGAAAADLGQRRARAGRHDRGAHLPARAVRRRSVAALHARAGRRDPDRHAGRVIRRRSRRCRRGRGRRAAKARPRGGSSRRWSRATDAAFDAAVGSLPAVDDLQRAEAWGSREAAGLGPETRGP